METIYNIPQLLDLIERKNLTGKQICRVLSEGFKIYADENQTRETLIQELKDYHFKYSNSIEKPLFLGCDIDVESYLKEQSIETNFLTEYKTTKAAIIASLKKNDEYVVGSSENQTYYLEGRPIMKFESYFHTQTPE